MDKDSRALFDALERCCRTPSAAVAVKLAAGDEPPPAKTRYPLPDLGKRLAVCQGMTLARTFGWSLAFGDADHACPFPRIFMGHVPPDKLLSGEAASCYVPDSGAAQRMEAAFPRWQPGSYGEVWLAPLAKQAFEPDVVVVYGTPAQILLLIQAANCFTGEGVTSFSFGRAGCVGWLVGVVQSGACTYMVPGPGERIFAGTQEHEISFAIPAARFAQVAEGLEFGRRQGMYRYPVPNLQLLNEPVFPEAYATLVPK